MIMNDKLAAEWDQHAGRFARKWRVAMEKKEKIIHLTDPANLGFRDKIEASMQQNDRVPALKDAHLIEAALLADGIVVSLEHASKRAFARATGKVEELRSIVWVDPQNNDESPIAWLERGAPPEDHRSLGRASRR